MKFFYPVLLMAIAALLPSAISAQITYVNHAATGTNDGTSWANAYTDLHNALDEADPGDILWVAVGTYRRAANKAGFSMQSGVKIYGGFKGNEAKFEDRNIAANPTVLSGDVAGDDVASDFTKNRTDNSLHVLFIDGDGDKTSTVDGFRFSGGNTATANTEPDLDRRGGGVLSLTPVEVANCTFSDNYGQSGAAIACVDVSASNSRIRFCTIENNESAGPNVLCSGVFLRQLTGGEIHKCVFKNNKGRGSCYPYYSQGIVIDSCLFESNTAAAQPGAGLYSFQASFVLKNSTFRSNKSTGGGAMYNDGVDGVNYFIVENCLFETNVTENAANTATFGGALYNLSAKGEFKKCSFIQNTTMGAGSRGGAVYNLADTADVSQLLFANCVFQKNTAAQSGGAVFSRCRPQAKNTVNIVNSLFEENNSTFGSSSGFGGASGGYDLNTAMNYDSCIFRKNTAGTSGGAVTNGFTASASLKNCLLVDNKARSGGGMFNQNDNTLLSIEGTTFTQNIGEGTASNGSGGALSISGAIATTIKNSTFQGNSADFGGAITMSQPDTLPNAKLPVLVMENVVVKENIGLAQGAGVNLYVGTLNATNSLFFSNLNLSSTGAGGAISNNASRLRTTSVKATNCTFAANDAPIGGGIGQYEDAGASAQFTAQNCIFQNNNGNHGIEDGTPDVFTLGGNCSSDGSMTASLNGTNDLNDTDPQFADPTADLQLKNTSPCINKAIAAAAPATDLLGKPRNGAPDMGCYEFQGTIGTNQPFGKVISVQLTPNPAVDFVKTVLDGDASGDASAQVFSAAGQLVKTIAFEKMGGRQEVKFSVEELSVGAYLLRLQVGEMLFSGAFLKS